MCPRPTDPTLDSDGANTDGGGVKLDVVIYNTVMSLCADAGEWKQVLHLVKQMSEEDGIKPDRISFDCLMKACGNGGDWEQALVGQAPSSSVRSFSIN